MTHSHDHARDRAGHAHRKHAHGHGGHVHAPAQFGTAFAIGIALNTAFVIVEAIFGYASNSTALPEVAFVFSKTGTAEMATDPMPPSASDTFVILKPQDQWPDPGLSKPALVERIAHTVRELPGNNYEFTQPIQMRFNELLAGMRGDLTVKVEQAGGLSVLEINVNKTEIARRGLSLSAVTGRDRHGDRWTRCRCRIRGRPPFRNCRAAARSHPQRSRRAQEPAGVAAPRRSRAP